ncbi:CpaF family protein [Roseibium sp.]|uniref:CpaF family protein n=1 Tax=Roseibium sp. TaxID=1936156 RepID=UPI003BAE59DA
MGHGCSLLIQYTSDRAAESFQLERKRYAVGSRFSELDLERGEIPLYGRDISAIQFYLDADEQSDSWFIEPIGTTETFLGSLPIGGGQDDERIEIKDGQHVQVPGARIQFRSIGSLENLSGQAAIDACIQIQDRIHDEVFQELALEPASHENGEETVETRLRLLKAVTRKTEQVLANAPEEVQKAAVASALRFSLLRAIAGSSIEMAAVSRYDEGPPRPGQLKSRTADLKRQLNLTLTEASAEEDTLKLDDGFAMAMEREFLSMPVGDRRAIAQWFMASNIWNSIFHFGPVTELMELDIVSEVMVVRYDRIYIERFDKLERYPYSFSTPEKLMVILKRLVNRDGREIDRTNAMVDFKLQDGSRVNAIIDPLSRNGPCVTIRRHRKQQVMNLEVLSEIKKSLSPGMARFLGSSVLSRKNIIVSGGTGSGKTTLLNALSAYVPNGQRVVTIEDTAELSLANQHVVSLESRPANAEGEGEVDIRKLVKNALRMRPDRIIVGECRGGEAVDMLQALNTGHSGSMTTAHANGTAEMLMRLEVMVLQGEPNLPIRAIRNQIVSAVDIIVQLEKVRLPSDPERSKKIVTEIAEVVDIHPVTGEIIVEPIFLFDGFLNGDVPKFRFSGYLPSFVEEIDDAVRSYSESGSIGQDLDLEDIFALESGR